MIEEGAKLIRGTATIAIAFVARIRREARAAALEEAAHNRPMIVCLCGSTRFWRTFQEASLQETLAGKIVLSIGAARSADDSDKTFGGYVPVNEFDKVKQQLDELHKRKIDLADEVLVLNVGGYIGESTRSEIEHAERTGKPVRYLEDRALAAQEPMT
jgi:hypothetical protein